MANAILQEAEPLSKRRKVRKGTRSCWTCRRRKVQCIFASPSAAICNNCKRRGTSCISQELEDSIQSATNEDSVEERLSRVEGLVAQLVKSNPGQTHVLARYIEEPIDSQPSTEEPAELQDSRIEVLSQQDTVLQNPTNTIDIRLGPFLGSPSSATTIPQMSTLEIGGRYADITRELLAAWPSKHDLELITSIPAGLSTYLDSGLCIAHSTFAAENLPSPSEILQLPPSGSHPVLIARKLLILGRFLQGILPSSIPDLEGLSRPYHEIMNTVIDKVVSLVTTNDELTGSIEGIECIMIECMYHNYAGNLHKAWLTAHRAIAAAQLMGLHRGFNSPSLKILEQKTRAILNPDHVCFRLVNFDRYLSLMLGLPQSSLETNCASPTALEGCSSVDRMERIHCAVAGCILQRKDTDLNSPIHLHNIDRLLQRAATELPPRWWLTPSFIPGNTDNKEVYEDMTRLNSQFAHYHLLLRLHLPYMLRSSVDRMHSHSKSTAVSASREILSRYIVFRTANPAHYYCRGTDFLAFIATTVMCLAYINYHSQGYPPFQSQDCDGSFNFLRHSHLTDRGIMERTLDILNNATQGSHDAISARVSRMIHHLLAIEANATNGTMYSTSQSGGDEPGIECSGQVTNDGKALQVHIPYFGTINFQRGAISKSVLPAPMESTTYNQPSRANVQTSQHMPKANLDTSPLHFGNFNQTDATPTSNDATSYSGEYDMPLQLSDPLYNWGPQEIDVALFDSLFRGTEMVGFSEEDTWAQWAGA